MPQRPGQGFWLCLGALALAGLSGCVERRMVIQTDPYGAVVYDEKNLPIGQAPVDRQFTYYGKYSFRVAKDGYKTQVIEKDVSAPWYEWFGLDFFSENLLPFTIRDVRTFNIVMQPLEIVPPESLMLQAEALRAYGMTKGVALPPTTPPVAMPPATGAAPVLPPNANPSVTPVPAANNPPVTLAPPTANPPVVPLPPGVQPSINPPTVPAPAANNPPAVQLPPPPIP